MQLDDWIIAASNQLIKDYSTVLQLHTSAFQQVGAALFDALFPKGSEGRGYKQKQKNLNAQEAITHQT